MKIPKLFITSIALIILGCIPDDYVGKGLELVNNSSTDVYFYNSEDFTVGHFPDTLLPIEKPIGLQPIVANGSSGKYVDPNWPLIYSELPEGKFSIYVFSKEEVDNSDWEQIQTNYSILKRIDFTFEELKNSDYTLIYDE